MYKWLWNALGWLALCILLPILVVYGGLFSLSQEVPDVSQMTAQRALQTLEKAGYRVQLETAVSENEPDGVVMGQTPAPGRRLRFPRTATVRVSRQPRLLPVPELVGLTAEQASEKLAQTGFDFRSAEEFSDTVEAGVVVSQNYHAGEMIKENNTVSFTVSKGQDLVTVPDVVGHTEASATVRVAGKGLKCLVEQSFSDTVKAGKVMRQSLEAGTQVKRGMGMILTVSRGPNMRTVPALVGRTLEDARWETLSVFLLKINWQYTDEAAGGTVLAQEPSGGTEIPKYDTVTLTVAVPYGSVPVPDVKGMTAPEADQALREAGLRMHYIKGEDGWSGAGTSYKQDRAAGEIVKKGTRIYVYFTGTLTPARIPDVMDLNVSAAVSTLKEQGFLVELKYNSDFCCKCNCKCNKVMYQNPLAGSQAAQNSAVTLTVGLCCGQVLMPDVLGMTFEQAAAVLKGSGLTAEQSADYAHDYAIGTVCRQRVEAGSPVTKGSVVTLYLNLLPNVSVTVGLSGACGDPE